MKKYVLLFVLFLGVTVSAQKELNAYEYVIIPTRFDFQKEANQYGVNLLLKYKFQQMGFKTFLDTDILPEKLRFNTCSYFSPALYSKSTMSKTIISIELLNCHNKLLFKTREGVSRSKNYKKSYNEAIRESLSSFGDYKLSYEPTEEIIAIKKEVNTDPEADKQSEIEMLKAQVTALKIKQEKLPDEKREISKIVNVDNTKSYLIAHKKTNGFLLVNSVSEKIEFIIHTTKMKDVFILKNKSGVIYKKDAGWVREYIDKERTVLEFLDIKF